MARLEKNIKVDPDELLKKLNAAQRAVGLYRRYLFEKREIPVSLSKFIRKVLSLESLPDFLDKKEVLNFNRIFSLSEQELPSFLYESNRMSKLKEMPGRNLREKGLNLYFKEKAGCNLITARKRYLDNQYLLKHI